MRHLESVEPSLLYNLEVPRYGWVPRAWNLGAQQKLEATGKRLQYLRCPSRGWSRAWVSAFFLAPR